MPRLFDPQGWSFHLKEVVAYGSVVRLRGYLGVRLSADILVGDLTEGHQEDILYVTDPLALRTILVKKHGDVFEEPSTIIECVSVLKRIYCKKNGNPHITGAISYFGDADFYLPLVH
jgi:hypothetical protein